MSKEFEKFKAEHKKLGADIKKYSLATGEPIKRRLTMAGSNVSVGEDNLSDSMVDAREKGGVTGSKIEDFMKYKGFSEAMNLLNKAAGMLDEEINALKEHCDGAKTTHAALTSINTKIDKDLKKRKDNSKSKTDIQNLQNSIASEQKDLVKSGKLIDGVPPYRMNYSKNFAKNINSILAKAPASQKKSKDDVQMPHQLTDRLIQARTKACTSGASSVKELCDKAVEAAQVDLKGAAPHLKAAQEELKKIKEISATYVDIKKRYQDAIDNSKDKSKIEKQIKGMSDAYTAAERTLRGTATVIKKAG